MVTQVLPEPRHVHFGFFDASLEPVLEVDDGSVLEIRAVSGRPDDPVPPEWIPPEIPRIFEQVTERGPGPHILTGPIAVRGARAGMVLEIEIREIRLAAPYGYNIMRPQGGMFPGEFPKEEKLHVIPIEVGQRRAELEPDLWVPLQPFFGILGVAPPPQWGRIGSRPPRAHGGNMDNKELQPGSRLFLPIWVDGARFSVGDGHAAQGDGEIDQTAIETTLEGVFRLRVRSEERLEHPFAVTGAHLVTMGFHEHLDEAARLATRRMLEILQVHYMLSLEAAYRLCSVAADLRITQVVNENKGVHMLLRRSLLDPLQRTPWFLE
jgi:acetamidase/formamidase